MTSENNGESLAIHRVTYDKILLFGDSLTELSSDILTLSFAITPALQHHYSRKLTVVARGYGGYSSEHLRHVLVPTLRVETAAGEKIRLLVLEVGTNDAAKSSTKHVETARYKENLQWMVETARRLGVERVIIVGPGPVGEDMLPKPADNFTRSNLEYSEAANDISNRLDVPFLDLWHAFVSVTGWRHGQPIPGEEGNEAKELESLFTDGVHLSGSGYRIWYESLLEVIRSRFPELEAEGLATILPRIGDLNREALPDSLWEEVQPRT